jgi:hypothetical protein
MTANAVHVVDQSLYCVSELGCLGEGQGTRPLVVVCPEEVPQYHNTVDGFRGFLGVCLPQRLPHTRPVVAECVAVTGSADDGDGDRRTEAVTDCLPGRGTYAPPMQGFRRGSCGAHAGYLHAGYLPLRAQA